MTNWNVVNHTRLIKVLIPLLKELGLEARFIPPADPKALQILVELERTPRVQIGALERLIDELIEKLGGWRPNAKHGRVRLRFGKADLILCPPEIKPRIGDPSVIAPLSYRHKKRLGILNPFDTRNLQGARLKTYGRKPVY